MSRLAQLCYGDPGTGKTTAAFSFANRNKTDIFHYLRADRDPRKLYRHFPNHTFDNVFIYESLDHSQTLAHIRTITDAIAQMPYEEQIQQWVVYDTISAMYRRSRDSYTLQRYGAAFEEVAAARGIAELKAKGAKQDIPFDSSALINDFKSMEWDIIRNRFFGNIVNPVLFKTSANVIFIAHASKLGEGTGLRGKFERKVQGGNQLSQGRFEFAAQIPDVHHALGTMVDTILHFSVDASSSDHFFYTIKETAAKWLDAPLPFRNFADTYMNTVMDNGSETLG
jgi:hypothetical protein